MEEVIRWTLAYDHQNFARYLVPFLDDLRGLSVLFSRLTRKTSLLLPSFTTDVFITWKLMYSRISFELRFYFSSKKGQKNTNQCERLICFSSPVFKITCISIFKVIHLFNYKLVRESNKSPAHRGKFHQILSECC